MTTTIQIEENDGIASQIMALGQTTVDFDFPIYSEEDLTVWRKRDGVFTELDLTTDYTVPIGSIEVEAGGTIELTTGAEEGDLIIILLDPLKKRTTDFQVAGDFFAEVLNEELDLLTQMIQSLARDLDKAIKLPLDSSITNPRTEDPEDGAALLWDGILGEIRNGPTADEIENAQAYALAASESAAKLIGTSTTSNTISVASKSFTTQANKFFTVGTWLQITSDANPSTNFMNGIVTSYSGTSLVVNVTSVGGSGTLADWTIHVSGARGATGATGAPGAGTGDMLRANNLSDVLSASTSRSNLGLGSAALLASTAVLQVANNLSDVAAAATAFANIKQAATDTTSGVVELATNAETVTGTDTNRATTPAGVAAAIAAAPTGAQVFLGEIVPSAVGSIAFTSLMSSTYDDYVVIFDDVIPASGSMTAFNAEFSVNNGSSYLTSAIYSHFTKLRTDNSSTLPSISNDDSANDKMPLLGLYGGSPPSTHGISGELKLFGVNSALIKKCHSDAISAQFGSSDRLQISKTYSFVNTASAINAIRFSMDVGNITSGKLRLYGIKKA